MQSRMRHLPAAENKTVSDEGAHGRITNYELRIGKFARSARDMQSESEGGSMGVVNESGEKLQGLV